VATDGTGVAVACAGTGVSVAAGDTAVGGAATRVLVERAAFWAPTLSTVPRTWAATVPGRSGVAWGDTALGLPRHAPLRSATIVND